MKRFPQIGFCGYCGGYGGDDTTYTPGVSAAPRDTARRKGPVEYLVTDDFEGWSCPDCKDILLDHDISHDRAELHEETDEFLSNIGVV